MIKEKGIKPMRLFQSYIYFKKYSGYHSKNMNCSLSHVHPQSVRHKYSSATIQQGGQTACVILCMYSINVHAQGNAF